MKIVMVDDHELFAKSIELILGEIATSFTYCSHTEDIIPFIKAHPCDLVFMDIHLKDKNGLEVGAALLEEMPELKLVFLSGYDLAEYHNQAIGIGAKGFLNKNTAPAEFIDKIGRIKAGETIFPKNDHEYTEKLTDREKEILQCAASGLTQQEIAETLYISRRTVNNHLQAINEKLSVNSTISAIVRGIELGLVSLANNR
ncbi:DNA-binding response regulator [Enterococcus sp. JM4C]|uniref:response regulator transcription factor n=1 Tax=Candidatus Enterococcus huntleyi TaxID=1857217 RepID=UPI001379D7F9|nr:response regulator transcription factor [Enterococcus sp. JM4C]KAF1295113.1 DNA-binding response regulator [Enterococcus sp. JM4C]